MAGYKQQRSNLTLGCLFLSLLALAAGSSEEIYDIECPTICPNHYEPVCGTDGFAYKQFSNLCDMQSINCRRNRSALTTYLETDIAWCHSDLVDNLHEALGSVPLDANDCLKPCAMIYQPLCVTNGKFRGTISNICLVETLQCALNAAGANDYLRVLKPYSC